MASSVDYDFRSKHKLSSSLTFILKYGLTSFVMIFAVPLSVVLLLSQPKDWPLAFFLLAIAIFFIGDSAGLNRLMLMKIFYMFLITLNLSMFRCMQLEKFLKIN